MTNISTLSDNFLPSSSRPLDLNLDNLFTVYAKIINENFKGVNYRYLVHFCFRI